MSAPEHDVEAAASAPAVAAHWREVDRVRTQLSARILGQEALVTRLLVALLCDGHLLVEGVPGLAKTSAVKALAQAIDGEFHRIQFTPDLLPADLTGTEIFRPQEGRFDFQPGPLFHNIVLADEVNRAPAKVQSALLEAMEERQVTVGRVSYPLPSLFLVMATQNPIEHDGVYALPEAQLDRFLLHVSVGYPSADTERAILALARERAREGDTPGEAASRLSSDTLFAARREVLDVHLAPNLELYLIALVQATRDVAEHDPRLAGCVRLGASPRATLALDRAARALAWLDGRDYVSPDDIHTIAPDVLRHRIILDYEAQAREVDAQAVIDALLARLPVP